MNRIAVAFTNWFSSNGTNSWVSGVAAKGTFIKDDPSLPNTVGLNNIPSGWTVLLNQNIPTNVPLTFTATADNQGVALNKIGSPNASTLSYKVNDGTWSTYSFNTVIPMASGDTVAFSGSTSAAFNLNDSNYYGFATTGQMHTSGNVNSLINYNGIAPASCFMKLFSNTNILNTPYMPATPSTLSYWSMFESCSNLTAASLLPATTLAPSCYAYMFAKCTSLTDSPVISATTLADTCYQGMFSGCTALTSIQPIKAQQISYWAYASTFRGCSNLSTVSFDFDSSKTYSVGLNGFRGAFQDSGLRSVDLPYRDSDTQSASAFYQMFRGCSSLTNITVQFTHWSEGSAKTTNWVNGVASNGTFTKPNSLTLSYSNNNIPPNWNVVNT